MQQNAPPLLETTPHGWQLKCGELIVVASHDAIGTTPAILRGADALPLALLETKAIENGFTFTYGDARFTLNETVQVLKCGLVEVERSWINHSREAQEVALLFKLYTGFQPTFTLIPCVSYNGNHWGSGSEPKGLTCEGKPWVFSYKRTGVPAATFSENDCCGVGVFVDSAQPDSLRSACSLEPFAGGIAHCIFWPEREEPKTYISKDRYGAATHHTIRLEPAVPFTVKCYVSPYLVRQERTGWTQTFDQLLEVFDFSSSPAFSPQQVWKLGIHYVKNVLFQETDEFAAFHIGLLPQASDSIAWELREHGQYEIGWCGQNATLAHALLHDYQVNGDEEAVHQAVRVLDSWIRKARFSNGLFAVRLDDVLASKKEIVSDTCNLGWGAWQMLRAYEKARQIGLDKPQWREFGLGLCDFFVAHGDKQGRFGKSWTQEGVCLDWEGTIGSFIVLPLLQAYRMTGEAKYLQRAIDGFHFYVTHDLERIECTAGALDTHCVDKETCWPLLAGALDLYELTGENSYLQSATLAGYYTTSWMFHFDALYAAESDFTRYNYRTRGATAVSTQHHHLDPWGALLCREWLRLAESTTDVRWRVRAQIAWDNCLLGLSNGELEIHQRLRPQGSQNEAFFHCNWNHYGDGCADGGLNDWLVAWPSAFRLLTLMDATDWKMFEGDAMYPL